MSQRTKLLQVCWTLSDPWTVTHQAPLSTGFSRQEYWNELPFPSSGGLPNPGIEPKSPALQADSLPSEPPGKPVFTYMNAPVTLKLPYLVSVIVFNII